MHIISRGKWGARAPRARSTVSWGDRTEFVVHYSEGPASQSVRSIQDFHMDGRDWSDVGYNFLVDIHGRIYEGRGWLTVGAHAPGHNSSGIGVCMIGRDGDATTAAERSIRALYDEACRRAGRRLEKLGHRDVYSTSCPGDQLYAWVRAGMPADIDIEEDDMPDYVSVGTTTEQQLPVGEWVTVEFDEEFADSAHHHWDEGGPSFINGAARYSADCSVRIEDLPAGTELQMRLIERRDSDGKIVERGAIAEPAGTSGATFAQRTFNGSVADGCRVRLQVIQYGQQPARIVAAYVKALAWPV